LKYVGRVTSKAPPNVHNVEPIKHTVAGIWCVTIPVEDYDRLRTGSASPEDGYRQPYFSAIDREQRVRDALGIPRGEATDEAAVRIAASLNKSEVDRMRSALERVATSGLDGASEEGCMWCLEARSVGVATYTPSMICAGVHIPDCPVGVALGSTPCASKDSSAPDASADWAGPGEGPGDGRDHPAKATSAGVVETPRSSPKASSEDAACVNCGSRTRDLTASPNFPVCFDVRACIRERTSDAPTGYVTKESIAARRDAILAYDFEAEQRSGEAPSATVTFHDGSPPMRYEAHGQHWVAMPAEDYDALRRESAKIQSPSPASADYGAPVAYAAVEGPGEGPVEAAVTDGKGAPLHNRPDQPDSPLSTPNACVDEQGGSIENRGAKQGGSTDSSCLACEQHQDESQLVVAEVRAFDIEERWVRLRLAADDEEMRGWAGLLGQLIQIPRATPSSGKGGSDG
jgi:hypothetical protein